MFFVAKDTSTSLQQNDTLGVSCWLPPRPPGTLDTWTECASNWLLSLRQLLTNIRHLGRGGLNVRRYAIWKARQREAQEAIWDDPRGYYFCNIVAVASRARGRGVGRKLFEVVTDEADKRGLQCYLESSNEVPNVEIYRRLGFEMRLRMECRDGEDVCMVWMSNLCVFCLFRR